MTAPFDPAAWVAEYEAIGGHVSVTHRAPRGVEPGLWLGLTFPRDPAGRGYAMQADLYDLPGDSPKARAVLDYIAEVRGVVDAQANNPCG
jgi:hypothetical protein